MDLSRPFGLPVIDHISKADYTLNFRHVNDVFAILQRLGLGALKVKSHFKHTFRLALVHSTDWNIPDAFLTASYYFDRVIWRRDYSSLDIRGNNFS